MHPPGPFFTPEFIGPSTEEQRALALEHTERTLREIRGLLGKLDLPITCMHDALAIYGTQLGGIMTHAAHDHARLRQSKIGKIMRSQRRGVQLSDPPWELDGGIELMAMSDEELDAEYAKIGTKA